MLSVPSIVLLIVKFINKLKKRNEIRVAHATQNCHWSKSMCVSIKSDIVIML